MKLLLSRILPLVLFASPAVTVLAADTPSVREIAERVDKRYNRLQSLTADFIEIYRGPGIDRTESGTVRLKRPGRMRWDYDEPRDKLFVTDGKTAWFYVPGERQARKAPLKKLDDLRSPLRYLLGKTHLEKELRNLALASEAAPVTSGNYVLRGVPRGLEDRVSEVRLEVTPEGRIVRIVAEEVDGSTTEFRFHNLVENAWMEDKIFRFTPPPSVETIEMREIAP